MKNANRIIAVSLLSMAAIACSEDEPITPTIVRPTGVEAGTSEAFEAQATLSVPLKTLIQTSPTMVSVQYDGDGRSNDGKEFSLSLVHVETYENESNFQIANGVFIITNAAGHELRGTYAGTGSRENGQLIMSQGWEIVKAEGDFAPVNGYLGAEITDRNSDGQLEIYISPNLR